MKKLAVIGVFCVILIRAGAQYLAPDSLGAILIAAVNAGDVAKTRLLMKKWHATGKPLPLGADNKPLLFLAIEGRASSEPTI